MNKKIFTFSLVAVMLATVFVGCKKGENDPALTLLSRKARISGVWNLSSANYDLNYGGTITVYSFDGSEMTISGGGDTEKKSWSEKMTINKDGTFSLEKTHDYEYWDHSDLEYKTGTYKYTAEGVWYFVAGNKEIDVKNKERVAFQIEKETTSYPSSEGTVSTTNTYTGGSNQYVELLLLDKLANDELISKFDCTYNYGDDPDDVQTKSGTATYTKEK